MVTHNTNNNGTTLEDVFRKTLWADVQATPQYYDINPLLAHYTSINTFEAIVRNNELWLSNPLGMNDFEEVRFGMFEGQKAFTESQSLDEACGTAERAAKLRGYFNHYFERFDQEHVIDTYIFCTSEYTRGQEDGLLSMWRGYAANGNGAALVFDTREFKQRTDAPIIIAPIIYASASDRRAWIIDKINHVASLIRSLSITTDQLHIPAYAFVERLKLFSLFTQHTGFTEEREWRIAYLPDRDRTHTFTPLIDYAVGPRGIERKLKLKFDFLTDFLGADYSLNKLIHRVILGPTTSSPIARAAVIRMLERYSPELRDRLVVSSIPFRP